MTEQTFAIGTFTADDHPFPGVVRDEDIWEIATLPGLSGIRTTLDLLENWAENEAALLAALGENGPAPSHRLDAVRVEAPILPRQIFCSGANYKKHVAQLGAKQPVPGDEDLSEEERFHRAYAMMEERARTGTPYAFVKLPSAVTGPYDRIILPQGVREPDWELELGVVIGCAGRNIARADALSHVAGYVVTNDISARDRIYRQDMKAIGTDWLASKNAATFLPMGPWIVPARFVPDPQNLHLMLKLNDRIMQDESTADMIFDVARQIEYISSLVQLLPGDVICTGSPAGNGTHYQRFLTPGDVVEGTITGLGTQRLTCVAEDAAGDPLPFG